MFLLLRSGILGLFIKLTHVDGAQECRKDGAAGRRLSNAVSTGKSLSCQLCRQFTFGGRGKSRARDGDLDGNRLNWHSCQTSLETLLPSAASTTRCKLSSHEMTTIGQILRHPMMTSHYGGCKAPPTLRPLMRNGHGAHRTKANARSPSVPSMRRAALVLPRLAQAGRPD